MVNTHEIMQECSPEILFRVRKYTAEDFTFGNFTIVNFPVVKFYGYKFLSDKILRSKTFRRNIFIRKFSNKKNNIRCRVYMNSGMRNIQHMPT